MFEVWKIWERGAPDLGVEIVSASDRRDADWSTKLARYQSSGIGEVVRFDQDGEQPLRVWDRVEGELLERAPESAHLCECVALSLWWITAPSPSGPMLRLARDREGLKLLPTVDKDRVRLEAEVARERTARSTAEHARALAEGASCPRGGAGARGEGRPGGGGGGAGAALGGAEEGALEGGNPTRVDLRVLNQGAR